MRCYSCGDDSDWAWTHHGHLEEADCHDDDGFTACHTVCGNCDRGLCEAC